MMEEEIKNYIKQQMEAGASRETIEKSLEENGWTREDIQNAFADFDVPDVNEELQPKVEENTQVSENETREENEIETGEIKSFGSFLRLCWGTKITRWSIILGVVMSFMGILPIGHFFIPPIGFFSISTIAPFVIIIGTWWGIREKRKITFLKFLLAIIVAVISCFGIYLLISIIFLILGSYGLFSMIIGYVLLPILSLMIVYLYTVKKSKTKSFKFLLKLFWGTKTAQFSIILGAVVVFIGVFFASFIESGSNNLGCAYMAFVVIIAIVISSLLIFIGVLRGTKKIKKGILKNFLLLFFSIIISVLFLFSFGYIQSLPEIKMRIHPEAYRGRVDAEKDDFHIYLYPEQEKNIRIISSDSAWEKTWNLRVTPDGHVVNRTNRDEENFFDEGDFFPTQNATKLGDRFYSCRYELTEGFVIRGGKKTEVFLEETLSEIGLTEKEINDFIDHWYPEMENKTYNLIHFVTDSSEYDRIGRYFTIEPEPDTTNKVVIVWAPLTRKIILKPQKLKPLTRKGFTTVEIAVFKERF